MAKYTVLLAPQGTKRAAKTLKDDDWQVSAARIVAGDADLLQIKVWRDGWHSVVYDDQVNLVASVGPTKTDKEGWELLKPALKRKGYAVT